MGKSNFERCVKVAGIALLAFGAGILVTFFLSPRALILIEAVLIIAVGAIFFCKLTN